MGVRGETLAAHTIDVAPITSIPSGRNKCRGGGEARRACNQAGQGLLCAFRVCIALMGEYVLPDPCGRVLAANGGSVSSSCTSLASSLSLFVVVPLSSSPARLRFPPSRSISLSLWLSLSLFVSRSLSVSLPLSPPLTHTLPRQIVEELVQTEMDFVQDLKVCLSSPLSMCVWVLVCVCVCVCVVFIGSCVRSCGLRMWSMLPGTLGVSCLSCMTFCVLSPACFRDVRQYVCAPVCVHVCTCHVSVSVLRGLRGVALTHGVTSCHGRRWADVFDFFADLLMLS